MIWFFQLLRKYVTPQPNICLITDRGKVILSALQSSNVAWEKDGLSSVSYIRHIASNFNKNFKNAELKRQLINIGIFSFFIFNFKFSHLPYLFFHIVTTYEMKQSTVMAKLSAMRSEFPQAVSWIDQIQLEKWAQAFDGGKRFGHMTTNLAECTNSVLRGARSLLIFALVKTTFETIKDWFVQRGTKADCMLRAGHIYP